MRRRPLFDNRISEELPALELPANAVQPVAVEELEIGMYVTALDKPWSDCQFATRGFFIRSKQDLLDIRAECRAVTVDTSLTKLSREPVKRTAGPIFGGQGRDTNFNW